jgi:Flp pilus assembly protein TadG
MRFARLCRLLRDNGGAAALEFALAVPVLVTFIVGIAQLGILFMANNGLDSAVAAGARYATIYPRPSDTQIQSLIASERWGLDPANMTTPVIQHGTTSNNNWVRISTSYNVDLNFVFFTIEDVTLSETRTAWVH